MCMIGAKISFPQGRFMSRLYRLGFLVSMALFSFNLGYGQSFEIGTSPNPIGSGARAMGMGNAFIAVADDATAAVWNPGGLAQLEKTELSFAGELLSLRESLSSTSNPVDLNYTSLVFPFYYQTNMVFSFSFLKHFRFDKSLQFDDSISLKEDPEEIKQERRFDFEQEGTFSALAPAYGINLNNRLSLGFTWNIWNDSITQASAYEKKRNNF